MSSSKGKWLKGAFTCGMLALGLMVVMGAIIALYLFTPLGKTVPSVSILQPQDVVWLQSGQVAVLVARGEAKSGIQRIDFLVNDLPENQLISSQGKQTTIEAVFPWYSSQPGIHKISVVAYDSLGTASSPDSALVVVTARITPETNTLELVPENTATSQGAEDQAGGGEAGENAVNPSSNPAGGESSQGSSTDVMPGESARPPSSAALSGEEREAIEEILQDLDVGAEFPVDLPNQPEDTPPLVNSFLIETVREGSLVRVNYSLTAADDVGLSRVVINAANQNNPLEPDRMQQVCGGTITCTHQDFIQLGRGSWILSAQAFDTSGQASEIHFHQIHVLEGGDPPAIARDDDDAVFQLDPQMDWGEVQLVDAAVDDIGVPRIAEYGCSGQIVVLEVPYTYLSDHGDTVYVGAWAENGPVMVAAGNVPVTTGSGVARFEMEAIAPDMADTTDQLQLHLMAPGGEYFYEETSDLPITWPLPQPDLRIRHASISEALGEVTVENIGCASVDGFYLRLSPVEGEEANVFVEEYLAPGGAFTWNSLLGNANLFSRGFKVSVDPYNSIVEINEDNNSFDVSPITIKEVQIYRIDIHDTSESWPEDTDQGEFKFEVLIHYTWLKRPRGEDWSWVLTKGSHEIGGILEPIIVSPNIEWNQDLEILLRGEELDTTFGSLGNDDFGAAWFTHSHDVYQENSWKRGGDFSATSDSGKFTIYWRIVLE